MKKYKEIALAVLIGAFVIPLIVEASGLGMLRSFGGKITRANKATEIQNQENANYGCIVPGRSFSIRPIGNSNVPSSYLAPIGVGTTAQLQNGQYVLGLYNPFPTSITCIYRGYPPSTSVVPLTPISQFNVSR